MKRKSESAAEPTFEVGDEVIVDSGKIIWTVKDVVRNVATLIQKNGFVGALTLAGTAAPAVVSRKVDVYRLTKVGS